MKKLFVLFAAILLISGCSENSLPPAENVAKAFEGDFSSSVIMNSGENKTEAKIIKNGMSISISVLSPRELSGMGIEISDEHARISYDGMEQDIKTGSLPEGTPFLLLEELFDELSDPEEFTLGREGDYISVKGEDFSALLSPDDFSIISAEFPLYNAEFIFSNWKFADAG